RGSRRGNEALRNQGLRSLPRFDGIRVSCRCRARKIPTPGGNGAKSSTNRTESSCCWKELCHFRSGELSWHAWGTPGSAPLCHADRCTHVQAETKIVTFVHDPMPRPAKVIDPIRVVYRNGAARKISGSVPRAVFTGVPENETKRPAPSIAGFIPLAGLPLAPLETTTGTDNVVQVAYGTKQTSAAATTNASAAFDGGPSTAPKATRLP